MDPQIDSMEEKVDKPAHLSSTYYTVDASDANSQDLSRKITALGATAGTVRNIEEDGSLILLPTPSDDPNDPLNWSQAYKWYMTAVVCMAVFMSNMTSAGPSIAIIQTSMTFGTEPTKTAYLFSVASLMIGVSMSWWSPLTSKFGKRPIYVFSYVLYLIFCFAAGSAETWGAQLGMRIIMACAAGAGEMLGPLTINDIWFVHERSTAMSYYQAFLSVGVAFGMIIDGAIVQNHSWRYIYWINGAIISVLCILVFFTFPETTFQRPPLRQVVQGQPRTIDWNRKHSYLRSLRLYNGTYTQESFWRLFYRPWLMLALPPVLFGMLTFAVSIGFVVAVTSNVALAFGEAYHFGPRSVGLCFFAGIIGSILGIGMGGNLTDWVSKRATIRNNGVREPEMRLPVAGFAVVTAPLALLLYGAGIQYKWHWIVPTIGVGLLNFSVVVGTNVGMVYAYDSYKPISEEVTTCILFYKAAFGFLLSFYTNSWVMEKGYFAAYGEMAAISGGVFLLAIPLYFFGKPIRQASLNWRLFKVFQWADDRDDLMIDAVE